MWKTLIVFISFSIKNGFHLLGYLIFTEFNWIYGMKDSQKNYDFPKNILITVISGNLGMKKVIRGRYFYIFCVISQ